MGAMKQKMMQFMAGRNGVDQLAYVTQIVSLVLLVAATIFRLPILYLGAMIGIVYAYFRILSKKGRYKRAQENQKFLNARYRAVVKFNILKKHLKERKTHRFFKCTSCRQKIRVPKGKGKICITCPNCRNEFIKKT